MAFSLFRKKPTIESALAQGSEQDTLLDLDYPDNALNASDAKPHLDFSAPLQSNRVEPSERQSNAQTIEPEQAIAATSAIGGFRLPFIGHMNAVSQTRLLGVILGVVFLIAVVVVAIDAFFSSNNSAHIEIAGDTLTHTQRMAKATHTGMQGDKEAFAQMQESRDRIANNLDVLENGGLYEGRKVEATGETSAAPLAAVVKAWRSSELASTQILSNKAVLSQFGELLVTINSGNASLLETAEQLAALKLQANAPPAELSASAA